MIDKEKTQQICNELKIAVDKCSEIIENLFSKNLDFGPTNRGGDIETLIDTKTYEEYAKVAKKHNMYIIADEKDRKLCIETKNLDQYNYVIIIDPLDGTCNLFSNLTFGANIAFGQVRNSSFRIKDIDCVIVVDYWSEKTYHWIRGKELKCIQPKFRKKKHEKYRDKDAFLYEIPDEVSYAFRTRRKGIREQTTLLKIFRKTFPDQFYQRRAIDCTGIRMLEVFDNNLRAYGDVRGVTKIWDTIPSIAFLLEANKFDILDGRYRRYTGEEIIVEQKKHDPEVNHKLGKRVIIIRKGDYDLFMKNTGKIRGYSTEKPKPFSFIVHGRDSKNRRLELKKLLIDTFEFPGPKILQYEPSHCRTLFQKFIDVAKDTDIAFVILAPDDYGKLVGEKGKNKRRARQNVIFEFGFFVGMFRENLENVIVLYDRDTKKQIEWPSDTEGIIYIDISNGVEHAESEIRRELEKKWYVP